MLDHNSSILKTFHTNICRYRFKRLPFDINLAQDVFQIHMNIMLEGLEGIINIADDIIVYGNDTKRHNLHLLALLKRDHDYRLVFNKENCTISGKEIPFFGLIYSQALRETLCQYRARTTRCGIWVRKVSPLRFWLHIHGRNRY